MSRTNAKGNVIKSVCILSALVIAAGLTGCNSGSSSSSTTTISGTVFAAAVNGASCEIQRTDASTVAGPFTTAADGNYSIQIPEAELGNDLILSCSGGSYTDEADGSTQTAGTLSAFISGGTVGNGDQVHATAGSTIIEHLISAHNKSLTDAQDAFENAFGYLPDTSIAPTDATNPAVGASGDRLLAGLRAAAFSQMTQDLGLTADQQFVLITALARDLSDGSLDGDDNNGAVSIDGSTDLPLDIQSRFSLAMLNFRDGGNDNTGLSNDAIGNLPFAKTVLTNSYKVEYLPGMMMAMEGKTRFQIRLTRLADDQPATGTSVTLMPMMHMATMNHATPVDGACTESATAGTYDCTIYYLMASSMMNGTSMGYWDLNVMIGGMMGESAHFHPQVMMAMGGDTPRADLKGIDDKIMDMMAMVSRRYHIFTSDLSANMGNYDFQVFIAARESMMSMPALIDGSTLNGGETYELIPGTIIVEMSTTDPSTGAPAWTPATSDGNGYWTANLSGLANGLEGQIYVRLSVSGEQKTTDGTANGLDYATFTVTPSSGMTM